MSESRPQHRPLADNRQVPLLLAVEREQQAKPETLRRRLHATLYEHLSGARGIVSRSPKCWQMGLRGERPVTLRDIAEVASHPGAEARLATLALAALLVDGVRSHGDAGTLPETVAAFAQESADVAPAFIRAVADGTLTAGEIQELRRETLEAEARLLRLRAALSHLEARTA